MVYDRNNWLFVRGKRLGLWEDNLLPPHITKFGCNPDHEEEMLHEKNGVGGKEADHGVLKAVMAIKTVQTRRKRRKKLGDDD